MSTPSSMALSSMTTNPAVGAATRAALELVVSSGVGILAIDRQLLDADTIKALSTTTFKILLPMFLGTSILKTITKYGLSKSSLAVPCLAITQCLALYAITTKILYPLCLSREEQECEDAGATAVCASFCNSGVVPLIFCDSLFRSTSNINDNLALSTGFVSMFLVGWSPTFWSFGRSVLLGNNNNNNKSNNSSGKVVVPSKATLASKIQTLLPAPVMGVLVGMALATIPILRRLFVGEVSSEFVRQKRTAPLGVVFDTAMNFGKAASPLSLLVLVSSLAMGAGFGKSQQHQTTATAKRSNNSNAPTTISYRKRWAIVSFSRFVVSPCLMLGLLILASKSGLIGPSSQQPMLWFVCILESCMPPAQNQVTMLQVENRMQQANEMATFLFSVYVTAMIPGTIIVSLALDKLGLITR